MLALAALALPLTWYGYIVPDGLITLLGLGLLGVAVLLLFIQAVVLAGGRRHRVRAAAPVPTPVSEAPRPPAAKPAPAPMAAQQPAPRPPLQEKVWKPEQDVAYGDARPAAKAAPEEMIVPEAFQKDPHAPFKPSSPAAAQRPMAPAPMAPSRPYNPDDAAAWPGQRGVSDWTIQRNAHKEAAERASERRPPRDEFARKYTQTTPVVRNILTSPSGTQQTAAPPTVQGSRPKPAGKSRGQCGQCGTILLAPPQRPIKLRCPTCSRVAHLE